MKTQAFHLKEKILKQASLSKVFKIIIMILFIVSPLSALQLDTDTFGSSSDEGFSVDDGDNNELKINGTHTSNKTYNFSSYPNATITVSFDLKRRSNKWESSDCIEVKYSNVTKLSACKNSLTTSYTTYSYSGQTDASGNFTLSFNNNANSSDEWLKVDNISIVSTAEFPPIMGDVPDQTISIGTAFSLDISSYVSLTDSDPILSYTLTGTLPAGLDFNTTTGIIDGTPTEAVTADLSVTATDNDGESDADTFTLKPIEIGWSQVLYETSEDTSLTYGDTSQLEMTISIDHAVSFPVSVSFATQAGTAVADSDYRSSGTTVTIPTGETSVTIIMDIYYDEVIENTEDFTVTLTNPTGSGGVILKENYDVATVDIMEQTTAPMCYSDNFNTGTATGNSWRVLANDGITPGYVDGRMRLTDLGYHQSSAITKDYKFPASGNIIITEFTYYSYAGDGADGIALVLYDSDIGASPWVGVTGGSLGYAQGSTAYSACRPNGCPGFQGGWLGLGLDEYGNYSNPNEGRTGTGTNSGFHSDAISIRGKGDSSDDYMSGYTYLAGTGTLSPSLDDPSPNTTPQPGDKYRMTVDARDSAHLYIKLERMEGGVGTYQTIITSFDAIASQGASPDYVRLALTGSTGGSTNIHEIDDMTVWGRCTPYTEGEDNTTAVGFDARETSINMADDNRSITTKIVNNNSSLNVISLDTNDNLASYAGIDNNRVYLFVEDTSFCSQSSTDMRTAISDSSRDWYVTFNGGDTYQTTPAHDITVAGQDKKIVINYINWSQVFQDANFNCSNSNTQAVLNGVPQCLNSNTKLTQVFPDLVAECLGGAKPACESNSYAASGLPSAPYDNEYGCYQCLAGGGGTVSCSTDNFAVRPDHFELSTPSGENVNLLTSAQEYAFPLSSIDGAGNNYTNNYTVANANTIFTLVRTMYQPTDVVDNTLNGTLAFSSTPFSITNGATTNASMSFDDVGKVNIQVKDINWSAVDSGDTPGDCSSSGRYICGDINATFIPEHFTLNNVHLNNDNAGNFTYLSNDLNISAHLDVNVTAKNLNDATTQNFSSGSWENPVDINISVASAATTPTINKGEIDTTQNLGFSSGSLVIPWSETNSTKKLMFNFDRDVTNAKNPFQIDGSEVTLNAISTYTDSGDTANVSGSNVADQNATFIYGRTNGPRQSFTSDSGDAYIYYEAYCNGTDTSGEICDKTLLPNGLNSMNTNDSRWFKNSLHTAPTNGTVGTVTEKGASNVTNSSVTETTGLATVPLVYHGTSHPYKTTMENNASSWLIYNKDNINDTTNEFDVDFLGVPGDWAGQHETSTTTNKNASDKTNRRVMW